MRQTRGYSGAPFSQYDLQNAEQRIAEVRGYIQRERSRLRRLQPQSAEAIGVRRILAALKRTLGYFQDHRNRIEDDLKGRLRRSAVTSDGRRLALIETSKRRGSPQGSVTAWALDIATPVARLLPASPSTSGTPTACPASSSQSDCCICRWRC